MKGPKKKQNKNLMKERKRNRGMGGTKQKNRQQKEKRVFWSVIVFFSDVSLKVKAQ